MKKIYLIGLTIMCFAVGNLAWQITHQKQSSLHNTIAVQTSNTTATDVLVQINDDSITKSDIDIEYEILTSPLESSNDMTFIPDQQDTREENVKHLRNKILNSLIEQKLLYNFIENDRHYNSSYEKLYASCMENAEDGKQALLEQLSQEYSLEESQGAISRLNKRLCQRKVTENYIQTVIYKSMTVSPEEIAAYFRQHPGEFTLPTQVEVSQIVLANEYKARRIYHKLNRRNFSAMAIKHSITPESATGGNLKAFSIGEVPRFFNVAFSMKVGQISDIIKSAYGFHILYKEKT